MIGITAWLFGKLIPQFGYKSIAIFGVLVEGFAQIGFACASYVQNVIIYTVVSVAMRILTGTGNAAATTTVYAIAAAEFGSRSTFMLSIVQVVIGCSYLVAPIIAAALYKVNDAMFLPLLIPGILYMAALIRFSVFYKPSTSNEFYKVIKLSSAFKIMFHPSLVLPTIVQMMPIGAFGYIVVYLTVYLQELGSSEVFAGILLSLSGTMYMVGSLVGGKVVPQYQHLVHIFMVVGCAGFATSLLCLILTDHKLLWVLYVVFPTLGLFQSLCVVSVFAFSIEFIKTMNDDMTFGEKTSCLTGAWNSANNFGRFFYAIFGGWVIKLTGKAVEANMGLSVFAYVITIGTIIVAFKKRQREKC